MWATSVVMPTPLVTATILPPVMAMEPPVMEVVAPMVAAPMINPMAPMISPAVAAPVMAAPSLMAAVTPSLPQPVATSGLTHPAATPMMQNVAQPMASHTMPAHMMAPGNSMLMSNDPMMQSWNTQKMTIPPLSAPATSMPVYSAPMSNAPTMPKVDMPALPAPEASTPEPAHKPTAPPTPSTPASPPPGPKITFPDSPNTPKSPSGALSPDSGALVPVKSGS